MTRPGGARWLLYGAYGYTGALTARAAVAAGERPVLAGRDARQLEPLAQELDLEWVTFGLDDPEIARDAIRKSGVRAVANCAGPYSATAAPMLDACIDVCVHYLDVCGELDPLAATLAQGDAAIAAGVAVLPGNGMILPTDCLIADAVAQLPTATSIELAIESSGGLSRGTARSMVEVMETMTIGRIDGELGDVPDDRMHIDIDIDGSGDRTRMTAVAWGDVVTAHHTTGIDDIVVYTNLSRISEVSARIVGALARTPAIGRVLRRALWWAASVKPNPDADAEAARAEPTRIWVRVTNPAGDTCVRSIAVGNAYQCTANAVVAVATRAAAGTIPPGVYTPSQAHGHEFVLEIPGVERLIG